MVYFGHAVFGFVFLILGNCLIIGNSDFIRMSVSTICLLFTFFVVAQMQKMKIAINCRLWIPGQLEGIGHFTQEVVMRWIKSHPQHTFILLFDRRVDLDFSEYKNVRKKVLFPQARHPWLFYLWFEWSVPRALQNEEVDVFFSPEAMCSQWLKVPTLITVHDLAYLSYPSSMRKRDVRYSQKNMPRFFEKADGIATVSKFSKNDIKRQFPDLNTEVRVIYNGCREIFQPLKDEKRRAFRKKQMNGTPYFLYYGSLNPRKNIVNLLHAYAQFKKEYSLPHQLVLGGKKGWKTKQMKAVYEDHPYREEIHFTGYLNDEEILQWLTAAEALVYISKFEGFGLPVLEAMQSGTAVVTTKGSSMEEVAGEAAFYANAEQPASIANAMSAVITDEKKRQEKVKLGLERAKRFNWDKTAAELWAFVANYNKL